MIDEVQTGFGRTGEWFGFQHAGITPDVVALAKGIANGMPVGAIWARDEVAAAFGPGDHGIDLRRPAAGPGRRPRHDRPLRGARRSAGSCETEKPSSRARLAELDGVDHVRGSGLLLGIELTAEALAGRTGPEVARACLDAGLVLNGITPTALRIAPPFIVTDEQIDEAVGIIAAVLADTPEAA